ncbi:MAG TPA: class IV adenylate cyclase [Anaerolinea thermolimosa]|mgnify:FL=1|uniref:Class IV adenylate cyclase n=1 Tax=Anaerolinea thermolimosa TaxID=229919 RepID=A0A3D1JGZ4_9CHLR|nr:class IV adenylate cyclase [Anaerolinea thermolimosa]GAP08144.1 adenylyl cyclase CyaB, putative [Anaerolinea thermolimosa]HCE17028.1 class IV adenylate cyclase [Anaerolinea thermolimosa]
MASNEQEIEAKFMVRNLQALQSRLEALGAQLESPRVYEINLRFDNERGELAQARQVLRLRRDHRAVMTFKGPARIGEEVSMRQEIEFEVSNFTAAQHLLEALGYHVVVRYEKYRTTYRLGETVVVLDEMPYGHFVEIEGENADEIRRLAEQLGLRWEARSALSYLALFEEVRRTFGLPPSDLSFRALQGVSVQPDDMGLSYADD